MFYIFAVIKEPLLIHLKPVIMKKNRCRLSIVIPCLNEAGNIDTLYAAICSSIQGEDFECLFVDDGSSDDTLARIKLLSENDERVRYISFARNFGQQKAILAGMQRARGAAVVTMDADMQHSPGLLPRMIAQWREGYWVVNTQRMDTVGIGGGKRFFSRVFYRLMNYLTAMPMTAGCADFRLMDRRVVDLLCRCPERDLFLRGMIAWCGFPQTVIRYQAAARHSGQTKYNFRRMLSLSADAITAFSVRPLRLSILLSALLVVLCLTEILYAFYVLWIAGDAISGWTSIVILISLIGAMILLMLGVVGEYVGRIFMQGKQRPPYIVIETNTLPDEGAQ